MFVCVSPQPDLKMEGFLTMGDLTVQQSLLLLIVIILVVVFFPIVFLVGVVVAGVVGSTSVVLLVVGLMIYLPYLIWKQSAEDRAVFRVQLIEHRVEFLEKTFGLSNDELKFLHFDGKGFHVGEGIYPFSSFSEIRRVNFESVLVKNAELPHRAIYEQRRSVKYTLRLIGATCHDLVTYSSHEVDERLFDSINLFLGLSGNHDFEAVLSWYEVQKQKLLKLESAFQIAEERKKELDLGLQAALRLGEHPNVGEKAAKFNIEQERLDYYLSEVAKKMMDAETNLANGVRRLNKLIADHVDVMTIESIRAT